MDILSNLVISNIHSANRMYSQKGMGNIRTNRPCWAAVMKYEGETEYKCLDKTYISDAKRLVLLPKGCSYRWECTKSGHFITLEFDGNIEHDRILSFSVRNSEKMLNEFQKAERCMTLKKGVYRLRAAELVNKILYMLAAEQSQQYVPNFKQKKLAAAVDYIRENCDKELSNDLLAREVGCSTVYFRKLFGEVYGISPMNYVNALRADKAKELLSSDFDSVGTVAQTLGYKNLYDFSRAFKRQTGLSPTEFVKKAKEG